MCPTGTGSLVPLIQAGMVGGFTLLGVVIAQLLRTRSDRNQQEIAKLGEAYSEWAAAAMRVLWEYGRLTPVSVAVTGEPKAGQQAELGRSLFEAKTRFISAKMKLLLLETDSTFGDKMDAISSAIVRGWWDSRLGPDMIREQMEKVGPSPVNASQAVIRLEKLVEAFTHRVARKHPRLGIKK
jgi:hypothetical protein